MTLPTTKRRKWPLAIALAVAAVALWLPGYASADTGTGTIAVCATDSTGTNIVLGSDQAWYKVGSTSYYVGAVGSSDCRESTLAGGTAVEVWVGKHNTVSQHLSGIVPSDGSTLRFDFYTTKVTLDYAYPIAFGGSNGDADWFNKPSEELFSDGVTPVHFRLDGTGGASARTTLLWPIATGTGATFSRALYVARLIDHTGAPLAGGTVDSSYGGWTSNVCTTDSNGNCVLAEPTASNYFSVAMNYHGTRNQQDHVTPTVVTFQTALANVKLTDADGNPLDTGSASYYAGGWQTMGNTSGGTTSAEMLPGSYSFAMAYNHTREQRNQVAISRPTTNVVFQTGQVTAYFSQPFSWYDSQFYPFTPATQQFLPSHIGLALAGCNTAKFSVAAGDHLVKTGIVATLTDSGNHPLSGGTASAYAGGWHSFTNPTGSDGKTCEAIDGHLGNTSVAMVYNGTRQQITQNAQANGIYPFQTADVSVELRDHSGNLMDTGTASYYAGKWRTIGDTSGGTTHVEMLPGSYSFAMTYNGTREQLNGQVVSGNSDTVSFQTTDVTVELRDHSGNLMDTGGASYYAGKWRTIGDTSGGTTHVEMLPGSYSFAMTYLGTREQLDHQGISGGSSTVSFQTGTVHSTSDTATSYYAGAWRPFTQDMELLSGKYWFAFSDAQPNTQYTLAGGTTNTIH